MNDRLAPPNRTDFVKRSSIGNNYCTRRELIQGRSNNTDLLAPDYLVVDPYAVVTDHHISNERRRRESRNKSPETVVINYDVA